jgi:DNA-binding beta-propeller fold protein YncE
VIAFVAFVAAFAVLGSAAFGKPGPLIAETSPGVLSARSQATRHFEYVLPDGGIWVYDIDRGNRLVQRISLPQARGIRGVVASPSTNTLYISFGGDGGTAGNGSLLAYDLLRNRVEWQRSYPNGVDSMAITPNGKTIYMPEGELASGSDWIVIDAATGNVKGSIPGGAGPHNTIVGLDGRYVYLAGRNADHLTVASTATASVVREIGPLKEGVRPFTINAAQTLAFTTATGFLGFQVSNISSGKLMFTVGVPGFSYDPSTFQPSAPSHGISLSPDERRLFLIDAPNSYVHVFDVSGLPASPPRLIGNIKLVHPLIGNETPCAYDCARDGWLQSSRDGRYVYVGDSGDVIATATGRIAGFVPTLRNTRKFLEIDWARGRPVATTSRYGLGYKGR